MSGLPSCALKTLSVFTSERIVFIACLLLSEYSFERLYHIANFEHDQNPGVLRVLSHRSQGKVVCPPNEGKHCLAPEQDSNLP